MGDRTSDFAEQFAQLSNADLWSVGYVDFRKHGPKMAAAARAELERRGVKSKPLEEPTASQEILNAAESTQLSESSPASPESGATSGNPNFRLSVGSIVGRTFSVWANNLLAFWVVGLIVQSPVLVGHVVIALSGSPHTVASNILGIAENLLTLILIGAISYGVFEQLNGERPELGDLLRIGLSRLGSVFGTGLLQGLAVGVGTCALIIPGLVLLTMFWVAVPVAVIETPGASASLTRSRELTEGNRWPIFGTLLVLTFSTMLMGISLGFLAGALSKGASPNVGLWAGVILRLFTIPFGLLGSIGPAIAYYDLRLGKEGVGVEELLKVFE